jgi:hypothetical protein
MIHFYARTTGLLTSQYTCSLLVQICAPLREALDVEIRSAKRACCGGTRAKVLQHSKINMQDEVQGAAFTQRSTYCEQQTLTKAQLSTYCEQQTVT